MLLAQGLIWQVQLLCRQCWRLYLAAVVTATALPGLVAPWAAYYAWLWGVLGHALLTLSGVERCRNRLTAAQAAAVDGVQVSRRDDRFKQRRLQDFLSPAPPPGAEDAAAQNLGAAAMAEDMEVSLQMAGCH